MTAVAGRTHFNAEITNYQYYRDAVGMQRRG
jgi:hypothetical protein